MNVKKIIKVTNELKNAEKAYNKNGTETNENKYGYWQDEMNSLQMSIATEIASKLQASLTKDIKLVKKYFKGDHKEEMLEWIAQGLDGLKY